MARIRQRFEFQGLCALVKNGRNYSVAFVRAHHHQPIAAISTLHVPLFGGDSGFETDGIMIAPPFTQVAIWKIGGLALQLGAGAPATINYVRGAEVFRMSRAHKHPPAALDSCATGDLGTRVAARVALFNGVIRPAHPPSRNLKLEPAFEENPYSGLFASTISFTPNKPLPSLKLGRVTIPLREDAVVSFSNFSKTLADSGLDHFDMIYRLADNFPSGHRKFAHTGPVPFGIPVECAPPPFFEDIASMR